MAPVPISISYFVPMVPATKVKPPIAETRGASISSLYSASTTDDYATRAPPRVGTIFTTN